VGSEKPPKGSSYNPPLPPLKISTSNGSPGFDYHQPVDKFEASKVRTTCCSYPHHPEITASEVTLGKNIFYVDYLSRNSPLNIL
jgi:hypothetical protein